MRIAHRPPRDYPEEYTRFTWQRLNILFDIHACNMPAAEPSRRARDAIAWWAFRYRVSVESTKWLAYALLRRKQSMLSRAAEGANRYEWWPVRLLRRTLTAMAQPMQVDEVPMSASGPRRAVHKDAPTQK